MKQFDDVEPFDVTTAKGRAELIAAIAEFADRWDRENPGVSEGLIRRIEKVLSGASLAVGTISALQAHQKYTALVENTSRIYAEAMALPRDHIADAEQQARKGRKLSPSAVNKRLQSIARLAVALAHEAQEQLSESANAA